MELIRSRDNPRVKLWSRICADARARRELGLCIVEGAHLVGDCLRSGVSVVSMLVAEDSVDDSEIARQLQATSASTYALPRAVMGKILDADSTPRIAAVIRTPDANIDLATTRSCVFLDGIQDPGNVGGILRTAAAFGAECVVLGPGCADPWSPKVLRAGMGGHFSISLLQTEDLAGTVLQFGGKVFSTAVSGGQELSTCVLAGRVGWVFGSEGAGVSAQVQAHCAVAVTVPMRGAMESLNVAACAAICLYEQSRQSAQ